MDRKHLESKENASHPIHSPQSSIDQTAVNAYGTEISPLSSPGIATANLQGEQLQRLYPAQQQATLLRMSQGQGNQCVQRLVNTVHSPSEPQVRRSPAITSVSTGAIIQRGRQKGVKKGKQGGDDEFDAIKNYKNNKQEKKKQKQENAPTRVGNFINDYQTPFPSGLKLYNGTSDGKRCDNLTSFSGKTEEWKESYFQNEISQKAQAGPGIYATPNLGEAQGYGGHLMEAIDPTVSLYVDLTNQQVSNKIKNYDITRQDIYNHAYGVILRFTDQYYVVKDDKVKWKKFTT